MTPDLRHRPPKALGYLRVSTEEQADSRAGLDAQRAALEEEARDRGWDLELVEDAGYSARDLDRPALTEALARLDAHKADVLVVSKLDRLSRSVHDFSGLLERSKRRGWSIVCLDLGVDTTERTGRFVANLMANVAELERGLISDRTRDALAAKKAAGVRLGRPQSLPLEVVRRVVAERDAGRTWQSIADGLVGDAVPTARGGTTWRVSTVQAVYKSQAAADLARDSGDLAG